jgi:hypothetical protein
VEVVRNRISQQSQITLPISTAVLYALGYTGWLLNVVFVVGLRSDVQELYSNSRLTPIMMGREWVLVPWVFLILHIFGAVVFFYKGKTVGKWSNLLLTISVIAAVVFCVGWFFQMVVDI